MDKESLKKLEKEQKILKNVVTAIVLIIIVILIFVSNEDLRNKMGSAVGCKHSCPKNYSFDEVNHTCYKEKEKSRKYINAYLLGDIDNNGIINGHDFNMLRSNISDSDDYNFIYDINQDRVIDEEDLTELASIISLAKTSGGEPASKYVCPNQEKELEKYNNKSKEYIITNYELENKNCIVKEIIRKEKQSKYSCG